MYRDYGQHVRMAYDPQQISEAAALAALCVRVPHLAEVMKPRRISG